MNHTLSQKKFWKVKVKDLQEAAMRHCECYKNIFRFDQAKINWTVFLHEFHPLSLSLSLHG